MEYSQVQRMAAIPPFETFKFILSLVALVRIAGFQGLSNISNSFRT